MRPLLRRPAALVHQQLECRGRRQRPHEGGRRFHVPPGRESTIGIDARHHISHTGEPSVHAVPTQCGDDGIVLHPLASLHHAVDLWLEPRRCLEQPGQGVDAGGAVQTGASNAARSASSVDPAGERRQQLCPRAEVQGRRACRLTPARRPDLAEPTQGGGHDGRRRGDRRVRVRPRRQFDHPAPALVHADAGEPRRRCDATSCTHACRSGWSAMSRRRVSSRSSSDECSDVAAGEAYLVAFDRAVAPASGTGPAGSWPDRDDGRYVGAFYFAPSPPRAPVRRRSCPPTFSTSPAGASRSATGRRGHRPARPVALRARTRADVMSRPRSAHDGSRPGSVPDRCQGLRSEVAAARTAAATAGATAGSKTDGTM